MDDQQAQTQTIEDLQKNLDGLPDDELQQIHDDIVADRDRFIAHVGIERGAAFLVHLLLEMRDRKMPVDISLPQPPEPRPIPYKLTEPESNVIHLTSRRDRRAMESKRKRRRRKR